jgi:hypothetical protein
MVAAQADTVQCPLGMQFLCIVVIRASSVLTYIIHYSSGPAYLSPI